MLDDVVIVVDDLLEQLLKGGLDQLLETFSALKIHCDVTSAAALKVAA